MSEKLWLIKDIDGEYITVRADKWSLSGDGLVFFLKDNKVAHFLRWSSYRIISGPRKG